MFILLCCELQSFLKKTWPRAYCIWSATTSGSWPVCMPSSTTCPGCTLEASSFEDTPSPCTQSPTASTSSQRQGLSLYCHKNKLKASKHDCHVKWRSKHNASWCSTSSSLCCIFCFLFLTVVSQFSPELGLLSAEPSPTTRGFMMLLPPFVLWL